MPIKPRKPLISGNGLVKTSHGRLISSEFVRRVTPGGLVEFKKSSPLSREEKKDRKLRLNE